MATADQPMSITNNITTNNTWAANTPAPIQIVINNNSNSDEVPTTMIEPTTTPTPTAPTATFDSYDTLINTWYVLQIQWMVPEVSLLRDFGFQLHTAPPAMIENYGMTIHKGYRCCIHNVKEADMHWPVTQQPLPGDWIINHREVFNQEDCQLMNEEDFDMLEQDPYNSCDSFWVLRPFGLYNAEEEDDNDKKPAAQVEDTKTTNKGRKKRPRVAKAAKKDNSQNNK
jgi:hypothetical protein